MLAALALLGAPAPATSADLTHDPATASGQSAGRATLQLGSPVLRAMKSRGVRITTSRPARRFGSRVVLPVFGGRVARSARLLLGGGLTLSRKTSRGTRRLRITLPELRLTSSRSRAVARVGGKRRTLLSLSPTRGRPSIDAETGRASLRGARVRLTPTAARAIRRGLKVRGIGAGPFGRLTAAADLGRGGGNVPGPRPGQPGAPNPAPIPDEPPVLTRPAGAVDVTGATITWDVRDSFIRYINSGEGTSTSAGATPGPEEVREGTSEPLVYTFFYPFARGWYDSTSGKAGLYYTGTVRFLYSARGIDFDAKDPEVEINGEDSRAIFRFDGRQSTQYENKRAVLVDLDLAKSTRTVSADGKTITYLRMPGTIPEGTANSVFAGFYPPGDEFGNISVSFTTP